MGAPEPRVTVIMPARDRARYIEQAIASVLAQTRPDLELIVVDDGSTDATPQLVAAIRDPRLRYLRQEPRGIGAAMNTGLRVARGYYIARLDSDDIWRPDLLEVLAAVLDSDSDVDVAYARGQAMNRYGELLDHRQGAPMRFSGDALRSMVFDDFTCNVALLARHNCIERVGGYDESLPANEDWDMWLRVARHSRFVFVDRVLAHIRWHPGNLTGPQSPALATVLAARRAPLDKLFAQSELPAEVAALRSLAYENVHIFCGTRWLQAGRPLLAARAFRSALQSSDSRLRAAVRVVWFSFNVSASGRSPLARRVTARLRAITRPLKK
jgi:GT2 family glycosyltransferase